MTTTPQTTTQGPWLSRFVWHDMMTTDAAKSRAFYEALLGWRIQSIPMGGFDYHMIHVGETAIGGIVEEKAIPMSHWMPYIAVPNVDAAATHCKELGGSVCVPPTDIPQTGRFAVCGDPQGAYFSIFTGLPESPGASPDVLAHGRVCWNELMTTDEAGALKFYSALLGWTTQPKDMGPLGTYHVQMHGDVHAGGIMRNPEPGAPAWWCVYFAVNDLAESTRRAKELGATVLMENQPIPEVGSFSLIQDPAGAMVALFQGR